MRKIQFAAFAGLIAALAGCGKSEPVSPQYGSLLYLNASPAPLTARLSSLYLDDRQYSNGLVAYTQSTGYLGVLPGTHTLSVRQDDGTASTTAPVIASQSADFAVNDAFTMISYDSLSTGNTVRLLKVRDTLTVPDVNSASVRFWQLSPAFPSATVRNVDVTYLRTSVTPNDSITFLNRNFPGATVSGDFGTFKVIPVGTYTIKIKSAGTQTVLANVAFTPGRRKIYTHYLTGAAAGRPLFFGQVNNF